MNSDPESECGATYCAGGACRSLCVGDSECKPGASCKQGTCAFAGLTKHNGDPCAANSDCASGFCADSVCCDTACNAGTCDACSVSTGATVNGTCKLLVGTRCKDDTAVQGACAYGNLCAQSGTYTVTTTAYACNSSGSCVAKASTTTSQACSRSTAGASCGSSDSWVCEVGNPCDTLGALYGTKTQYTCQAGVCTPGTPSQPVYSGACANTPDPNACP
jgi:hypothetical protein